MYLDLARWRSDHLETFDPKDEAPAEVRGPFRAVSTNVPAYLSANTYRPIKICDKLAILRSVTSPLGEHGLAHQYLLTGYKPNPVLQYPSLGAVVSRMHETAAILPSYIAVPELRSGGAGYLGSRYEPFSTGAICRKRILGPRSGPLPYCHGPAFGQAA